MKSKTKTIYIIILLINIIFITIPMTKKNYVMQEKINLTALTSSQSNLGRNKINNIRNFKIIKKVDEIAKQNNAQAEYEVEQNLITIDFNLNNSKNNFFNVLDQLKKESKYLGIDSIEANFESDEKIFLKLVGNTNE